MTVSTGVLAFEEISFAPDLPDAHMVAVHDLPMGLLTKIPIAVSGTRLGLTPFDDSLIERHARPGKSGARAVLRRPVGGRIWLAAEALAGRLMQTAAGARLSGAAVAAKVVATLGGQPGRSTRNVAGPQPSIRQRARINT